MENIKALNEEDLEKVVGGIEDNNPYRAAIVTAIVEIKMEMDILNAESGRPEEIVGEIANLGADRIIRERNEKLLIYGIMLSKFSSVQAIENPTADDIKRAFDYYYVMSLSGRPKEIFDKFNIVAQIQWAQ